VADVYVTGHRNPDLDSIGSAIGYAELRNYVPVRLGPVNAQTAWALEHSGAPEPALLEHIRLRAADVMHECVVTAHRQDTLRSVGLAMAEHGLDMVPVVGDDGALAGVVSERELARLYVRESQGASSFAERPVRVAAIAEVLGGEILVADEDPVTGRLWVVSTAPDALADLIEPGDIAVVGDLPDVQRRAVELGVALLITSNGARPPDDVIDMVRERGVSAVVSPLDSYVSGRMTSLAVPCEAVMRSEPLTVGADDVLDDVAPQILEVSYRAAIVVDEGGCPRAIVSRSDLVNPRPRRVVLVDHAERDQSVPGVEHAEIVEILDHHHIGGIHTRAPVRATFDPVGSTATLVTERFLQAGREPSRPTALMLLAAVMSDTVVLGSPTTTGRDREAAAHLGELVGTDPEALGRELFRASSDVSDVPAAELIARDAKEYADGEVVIAQVETAGPELLERRDELRAALEAARGDRRLAALMVTDVVRRSTELLVAGDVGAAERAFGVRARDGGIELPGVMSRKKQVAPKLMA
jgi:manganese-dependent inorganic pyrophosphatase